MTDDTPTRDEIGRLTVLRTWAEKFRSSPLHTLTDEDFTAIVRECEALSAALERTERERDELDDAWAALLITEKAKTAQAERKRDEAREALEKVRRDERERAVEKLEDHFPGTLYASNRTRCAAAIRGDDT